MSGDHTVLLVDDDPSFREMLALVLESRGFHTLLAGDGAEALEKLRAGPRPELMVVDLRMPRMNGIEFLHALHRDAAWRDIPAIVMTGDLGGTREALAAGARACLYKPFDPDELLSSIREHASPS